MSYANCHLVELSIKIHPSKFGFALSRDDDEFTDITMNPRFEVVKHAKFCNHCDKVNYDCDN